MTAPKIWLCECNNMHCSRQLVITPEIEKDLIDGQGDKYLLAKSCPSAGDVASDQIIMETDAFFILSAAEIVPLEKG